MCSRKKGAVCVGLSTQGLCWRRLRAEGLCEPSCLAPAPHRDVGGAGRNSEFLRGHSSHSCTGPLWPPRTQACLQPLLLKPIAMAPFQTRIPYSFSHARVEANLPLVTPSLHLEASRSGCTFPARREGNLWLH